MKQKEIKKLASEIWTLEKKCQDGEEVAENMDKMAEICESLSFEEMLCLAAEIEALT